MIAHAHRHPQFSYPYRVPMSDFEIAWGHPLTRGLALFVMFNREIPFVYSRTDVSSLGFGSGSTQSGPIGPGIGGIGGWWGSFSGSNFALNTTAGTVAVLVTAGQTSGNSLPKCLFEVGSDAFDMYAQYSDNSTYMGWVAGGRLHITPSGSNYTAGQTTVIGCTYSPSGTVGYTNGATFGSTSTAPTTSASTTGNFVLGGFNGSGSLTSDWMLTTQDRFHWLGIWDNALTAGEMGQLNAEPFSMLRPVSKRIVTSFAPHNIPTAPGLLLQGSVSPKTVLGAAVAATLIRNPTIKRRRLVTWDDK